MNYRASCFLVLISIVSCSTVKDVNPPYYVSGSMRHFIKEEHITSDTLHIEKLIISYNDLDRNRELGDRFRHNHYINKDSVNNIFIKAIEKANYNIKIDDITEYLNEEFYLVNNPYKFRIRFDQIKLILEKSDKSLILLPIIYLKDYYNLEFPPPVRSFKETSVILIFLIFDNKVNEFIYRSSFRHELKKETSSLTHEEERQLPMPHTQENWDKLVELTLNRYIQTLNTKK